MKNVMKKIAAVLAVTVLFTSAPAVGLAGPDAPDTIPEAEGFSIFHNSVTAGTENLFDGDTATTWTGSEVVLNFEESRVYNQIEFQGANLAAVTVSASDDGATYTTLDGVLIDGDGVQTFRLEEAQTSNLIKIEMTGAEGADPTVAELQVLNGSKLVEVFGKTATASSESSSSYAAANVFDGYTGTANQGRWAIKKNDADIWLLVDMKTPVLIGSLVLYERTASGAVVTTVTENTALEVSSDGVTYQTLDYTLTADPDAERIKTLTFAPTEMRYFRLRFPDADTTSATLYEVTAPNILAAQTEPEPTPTEEPTPTPTEEPTPTPTEEPTPTPTEEPTPTPTEEPTPTPTEEPTPTPTEEPDDPDAPATVPESDGFSIFHNAVTAGTENLFDGDTKTTWTGNEVALNFEESRVYNQIEFQGSNLTAVTVSASDDGATYTMLDGTLLDGSGKQTYRLESAVTSKMVKIEMAGAGGANPTIAELQVRNGSKLVEVFGKTVTASSEYSDSYAAANVFDGYTGTANNGRWAIGRSGDTNVWLLVDMKTSVSIESIVLYGRGNVVTVTPNMIVEGSQDGVTFEQISYTLTTDAAEDRIKTATFEPTEMRYFRLRFPDADSTSASLYEVAVPNIVETKEKTPLEKDYASLTLGNVSQVTQDFALPQSGFGGSQITWTSSSDAITVQDNSLAVVKRTSRNQTVTLTATLTLGGESMTKTFLVTVAARDDLQPVALTSDFYSIDNGTGRIWNVLNTDRVVTFLQLLGGLETAETVVKGGGQTLSDDDLMSAADTLEVQNGDEIVVYRIETTDTYVAEITPDDNLAQQAGASYSAMNALAAYPANQAFDGDYGTMWESSKSPTGAEGTAGVWLAVDFGKPVSFNRINLTLYDIAGKYPISYINNCKVMAADTAPSGNAKNLNYWNSVSRTLYETDYLSEASFEIQLDELETARYLIYYVERSTNPNLDYVGVYEMSVGLDATISLSSTFYEIQENRFQNLFEIAKVPEGETVADLQSRMTIQGGGENFICLKKDGYLLEQAVEGAQLHVKSETDYKIYNIHTGIAGTLEEAAEFLTFDKLSAEPQNMVTQNLNLVRSIDNYTVRYLSTDSALDAETGAVTRPRVNDVQLTLTAIISDGTREIQKTFDVVIQSEPVEQPDNLAAGKTATGSTAWSQGPAKNATDGDMETFWQSLSADTSNTLTIDLGSVTAFNQALVQLDPEGMQSFVLEGSNDKKTYTVFAEATDGLTEVMPFAFDQVQWRYVRFRAVKTAVDPKCRVYEILLFRSDDTLYIDAYQLVNLDADALDLGDLSSVRYDLALPQQGANGTTILWSSDNEAVLSSSGTVHRGTQDQTVVLTARVRYCGVEVVRTFSATVMMAKTAEQEKREIADAILLKDLTSERYNAITKNLTLPESGLYQTPLTWQSSNPGVISDTGVVTRQSENTPVTLTVTFLYDGEEVVKTFDLTVLGTSTGSGSSSGSGGGGGGSSSGGGRATSGGVSGSLIPSSGDQSTYQYANDDTPGGAAQTPSFTDLEQHAWAQPYIETLLQKGIVNGVGDGQFAPERLVTREEFVKMVVLAFDLPLGGSETPFADCNADDWYAPYVAAAYENGIIRGVSDTEFGLGTTISRQDMMVIGYNLLALRGEAPVAAEINSEFTDRNQVDSYAAEQVGALTHAGYINGVSETELSPREGATRAQSSKFICALRHWLD